MILWHVQTMARSPRRLECELDESGTIVRGRIELADGTAVVIDPERPIALERDGETVDELTLLQRSDACDAERARLRDDASFLRYLEL